MFVNKLRVTIAAEKHAKIIEPGDNTLQLNSIHEEDRERHLVLAYKVQERVLQILGAFSSHLFSLSVHPELAPGSGALKLADAACASQGKVQIETKAFG